MAKPNKTTSQVHEGSSYWFGSLPGSVARLYRAELTEELTTEDSMICKGEKEIREDKCRVWYNDRKELERR